MQGSQTLGKTKKPKTSGQRLSAGNIEVRVQVCDPLFSFQCLSRYFIVITKTFEQISMTVLEILLSFFTLLLHIFFWVCLILNFFSQNEDW